MNGVEIGSIDKKIISRQTKAHLKRLAFEEIAPYLRVVLDDGALVHEGSDHIAVHLDGRQDRVLFIRRTNTRGRRPKMKKLFSLGMVAAFCVLLLVPTAQAVELYLAEDPENPYVGQDVYPMHGYEPWGVYWATNLDTPYVLSSDYTLPEVVCNLNNDIIRTTLQDDGVYEGEGTNEYPNLKGTGQCLTTVPSQKTYVLGNYLNYLAVLDFQRMQEQQAQTRDYMWPPVAESGHMYMHLQSF